MERTTIPVPAESARQVAIAATEEISEQRNKNNKNISDNLEKGISHILEQTAGNDGEYVSLDADLVSHVLAFSPDFTHHGTAVRTYLEQYKIW